MPAAPTTTNLKLISLLGEKLNLDIYSVTLPSKAGQITIFPDHEPLITTLHPGTLSVREHQSDPDQKLELYAISGGIAKIANNKIIILSDEAESARDISEKEAKEAYDRAVKAASEAKGQLELEEAKRLVSHQAARLKLANLRRRPRD